MNLILGQGIAGSVLAIRLLQRGKPFLIVDDNGASSSSKVAAGLWNPIVFRRINKSWMADEFCSELERFYPEAERLLGAKFYYPKSVWRMHSSTFEAELWQEKLHDGQFSEFIHPGKVAPETFPWAVNENHANGIVNRSGYLDLPTFLYSARKFFLANGIFFQDHIQLPQDIDSIRHFEYRGIHPARIIDCRGHKTAEDPAFSWLPFGLTKGEVLTIRCEGLPLEEIFNAGFFLCPIGEGLFRLGATFNWNEKDEIPTESARTELLQKMAKWLRTETEVIDHKAGIRPTVQDRRPLMGNHPAMPTLSVFNGLGTKGVMLAPWLSNHLCDYLFNGAALLPDVNIDRFKHLIGQKSTSVNYPFA